MPAWAWSRDDLPDLDRERPDRAGDMTTVRVFSDDPWYAACNAYGTSVVPRPTDFLRRVSDELPYSETGKLLRRVLRDELRQT